MSDLTQRVLGFLAKRGGWATTIEYVEKLEALVQAKQARIDELMLEYCPEEVTEGQMAEWARHQAPMTGDEAAKLRRKLHSMAMRRRMRQPTTSPP